MNANLHIIEYSREGPRLAVSLIHQHGDLLLGFILVLLTAATTCMGPKVFGNLYVMQTSKIFSHHARDVDDSPFMT